jgi:hypothetical protein
LFCIGIGKDYIELMIRNKIHEIQDKIDLKTESLKFDIYNERENLFNQLDKISFQMKNNKLKKLKYYQNLLKNDIKKMKPLPVRLLLH